MKATIAIILIGLCGINSIRAQSLRYPIALPYTSLGAYSKQGPDPFSFTVNQAALAPVKHIGFALYSERRFLLTALSAYRFAAILPTSMGNFGVQLDYAGFKNFNENKIGLAYARSLGPVVDLGIQFNYYGYRVPAYGSASAIFFEAGAIIHFTEKLHGGITIYNPMGGKLGKNSEEKLASAYTFGFGYDVSVNFLVTGEVIKEEDKPVNVITGVQYHFTNRFFARAGISSESGSVFAGAGVGWNNLRLDVSASYHPQLGFSPGILIMTGLRRN